MTRKADVPGFLHSKYDHVDYIASGGHGSVYKCEKNLVVTAVKILEKPDPEFTRRFSDEIQILRRFEHENIVKLLDAGMTDGFYWYESEYAPLGNFGVMHSYLHWSDLDLANYFRQICGGVQALHTASPPVIHRDLKPSNILVFDSQEPGQIKLLKIADFGISAIVGDRSRVTLSGAVLGTGAYMAPERIRNPLIRTPESDIYSLGITFLEACTGLVTPSPDILDRAPIIFRPFIERMIRESPQYRYHQIAEVIEDLDNLPGDRLFLGRDLLPNEGFGGQTVFHVNIGRLLENAWEALLKADSSNVIDRLAEFEVKLDRLGAANDHEADQIMRLTGPILRLIDEVSATTLYRLVVRFLDAADKTTDRDHFEPVPDMWPHFLSDAYHYSSHRATRERCLEGLVSFLDRFGNPWTKIYLCRVIDSIEDPSYMEFLAARLREIGRDDVAQVLDGVPDQRSLDAQALKTAIRWEEQD